MFRIEGRHVLFALVAFFGVMLAVNGVFVYFATSTFSGLSTEDAYRKGLNYNQVLDAKRAQSATGWTYTAEQDDGLLRLTMQGPDGKPVERLDIRGRLGRPATDVADRAVRFFWHGGGLYTAETGMLPPGQWDLTAEARSAQTEDSAPFRIGTRLWVKQ